MKFIESTSAFEIVEKFERNEIINRSLNNNRGGGVDGENWSKRNESS